MQRPDRADLRTKMSRPDEALDHLYMAEQKLSRSNKSAVYLALVDVERYIIYLEKKISNLEKK
jgi:hypothetical protein